MEAPADPRILPAPKGLAQCFSRGVRAIVARPGIVALAVLAIAAAQAPQYAMQARAEALADHAQDAAGALGGRTPGPDEALEQLRVLGGACGWTCMGLAYGLVVVVPVLAGACIAVARAVAGDASARDVGCAFGPRFGPVFVTGLATALVGGGAVMMVGIVAAAGGVSRAGNLMDGIVGPGVVRATLAVVVLVTAWLTARLWFALPRAADPRRPRVSGVAAVLESWTATEGAGQWQVLALLAASVAFTVACMMPGTAMLADAIERTADVAPAWAVVALGGCVGVAFGLAMLGAAYESLMPAPMRPPPPPPAVPHSPAPGASR